MTCAKQRGKMLTKTAFMLFLVPAIAIYYTLSLPYLYLHPYKFTTFHLFFSKLAQTIKKIVVYVVFTGNDLYICATDIYKQ